MKTKVNKLVKITAAGLFLIALAINVKVTMDDPFVMVSEQALATGTGGSGGCTGDPCDDANGLKYSTLTIAGHTICCGAASTTSGKKYKA